MAWQRRRSAQLQKDTKLGHSDLQYQPIHHELYVLLVTMHASPAGRMSGLAAAYQKERRERQNWKELARELLRSRRHICRRNVCLKRV
ncbi:hypothetical protein BaRGS_00017470 [Batillaria attramentaria]|uniref:Uncharacterized protein n=1 Tax=Batillaria attramentaria TaxID=370345 RepID=A0ABD0KWD0_9CAEN